MWELEEAANFHQLSLMTILFFFIIYKRQCTGLACQNSKLESFTHTLFRTQNLLSGRFNYLDFCSKMSFKRFEVSQFLKGSVSCSAMSGSLQPHGLQPTRLLCPRDFPGENTGVFAISFSMGSSQPRDQTWVMDSSNQSVRLCGHWG